MCGARGTPPRMRRPGGGNGVGGEAVLRVGTRCRRRLRGGGVVVGIGGGVLTSLVVRKSDPSPVRACVKLAQGSPRPPPLSPRACRAPSDAIVARARRDGNIISHRRNQSQSGSVDLIKFPERTFPDRSPSVARSLPTPRPCRPSLGLRPPMPPVQVARAICRDKCCSSGSADTCAMNATVAIIVIIIVTVASARRRLHGDTGSWFCVSSKTRKTNYYRKR